MRPNDAPYILDMKMHEASLEISKSIVLKSFCSRLKVIAIDISNLENREVLYHK